MLRYNKLLTDVVVLVSWAELEAQGKGCKELKLLGELEWPTGAQWPIALPAFEASDEVVAGDVAVVANHVEDVALHTLGREWRLVVWTVDVQVVVDGHLHRVLTMYESGKNTQTTKNKHNSYFCGE